MDLAMFKLFDIVLSALCFSKSVSFVIGTNYVTRDYTQALKLQHKQHLFMKAFSTCSIVRCLILLI